ncbi:hypothetical protein [Micromonospora sp. Llam0]|uniref:hypothetical protein n=1 Tax=Micromonospora sp. Llam0 TaxID=2485143 RepID=UPI000F48F0C4|nr:hypothetical protein [Micromonospora sp. Llam0]
MPQRDKELAGGAAQRIRDEADAVAAALLPGRPAGAAYPVGLRSVDGVWVDEPYTYSGPDLFTEQ